MRKTLEPREEIVPSAETGESRPLPEAPVNGQEHAGVLAEAGAQECRRMKVVPRELSIAIADALRPSREGAKSVFVWL
ncbi:hypothetical protein KTAU_09420 [Thermogemmatispora aurantia]|uniref:Uncharacterized protein n=1 Tax=Thermogemmatispora aurantia TaxID=2045279 RepID=A0A5J4JYY7_9CHLR|nr:hypothetical protein KTAU_09420 [Thermogemmatispora aurantia]